MSEDVGSTEVVERVDSERIETTNINLAAALMTNGKEAHLDEENVDRSDSRHVKIAVIGRGLSPVKREWDTWDLVVNARKFAAHLKDVKALIHAED